MEIPKHIIDYARNIGANIIAYRGAIGKSIYYSFAFTDSRGMVVPTGLPSYIVDDGEKIYTIGDDSDFSISNSLPKIPLREFRL